MAIEDSDTPKPIKPKRKVGRPKSPSLPKEEVDKAIANVPGPLKHTAGVKYVVGEYHPNRAIPQGEEANIYRMAMIGMTQIQIADYYRVDPTSLEHFIPLIKQAKANRHLAILEEQFNAATDKEKVKGSPFWAYEYGKLHLGHKPEAQDINLNVTSQATQALTDEELEEQALKLLAKDE